MLALVLLLGTSGCTSHRHGLKGCLPPQAPPSVEEAKGFAIFMVRTDAGSEAARETGRFMEQAVAFWIPLFGDPDPSVLPLEVRLYRDPADMTKVLAGQGLATEATGLYLPGNPAAIHVSCWGEEPGHPYRTLLHEGSHQFAHLAAGYLPPAVPGGGAPAPILGIPLWLNEGLACYFEAAFLGPESLKPGNPDPERLAMLQESLRSGTAPPLAAILAKRYGEPFSSLDYAVSWGLVHSLMQETPPSWAQGGREWLAGVIDEGRRGWPGGGGVPDGLDPRWWRRITDGTRLSFEGFVAGHGLDLPAWEAAWRNWLRAQH
jgi:hypothetical protein